MLADSAGTITDRMTYDAYGVTLGDSPSVLSPQTSDLGYSGEQYDPHLQMAYHRARYYDPAAGLWNRLDPFAGNHFDPQSLHKYVYCHSDPVNGVDPTGLAVYFVLRKFATPGIKTKFLYKLMDMGHGYLLFTAPNDPGNMANPFNNGYALLGTISWHPNEWDYADESGVNDMTAKTPGRVWESHPDDTNPKDYGTYLITADATKQTALRSSIVNWCKNNQVGYDRGKPQNDPTNINNQIGFRHYSAREGGIYYSLLEQNCVWWATSMILRSGIKLSQDVAKVISTFNKGGGAADNLISGRRNVNTAHRMTYIPTIKGIGKFGLDFTLP
jgi:RHS repeat-associated protein